MNGYHGIIWIDNQIIGMATDLGRSWNSCIFPRWLAANLPHVASTTAAIWEEHRSFFMSKLQGKMRQQLFQIFPHRKIYENYRPDWLDGLELDFYIPSLSLAIEVNGIQHYEYIPHFHRNYSGYEDQIERDEKKRILCQSRGIELRIVFDDLDCSDLINSYKEKPRKYYKKMPKKQADTVRAIERFYRRRQRNIQRVYSMVARIMIGYEKGEFDLIDREISSFYLVHRTHIDKLILVMR